MLLKLDQFNLYLYLHIKLGFFKRDGCSFREKITINNLKKNICVNKLCQHDIILL